MNDNNKKQRKPRCGITGKDIEPKSGCPKLNPEMFEQPAEEAKVKTKKSSSATTCPVMGEECEYLSVRTRQRSDGVDGQFKYCMKSDKQLRSNTLCPLGQAEKEETTKMTESKKSIRADQQRDAPIPGEEKKVTMRDKMQQGYQTSRIKKLNAKVEELEKECAVLADQAKKAEEENRKLIAANKSAISIADFQKKQLTDLKNEMQSLKKKTSETQVDSQRDQKEIHKLNNELAEAGLQIYQLQDEIKSRKKSEDKAVSLAVRHDEKNLQLILELEAATEMIGKLEKQLQTPCELEEVQFDQTDRVDKVIDVLHALLA
jgi:chromosome segregation ATPase